MDKVWLLSNKSKRMRIKKTFSNAKKTTWPFEFFFWGDLRSFGKKQTFFRRFEEENRNWGDLRGFEEAWEPCLFLKQWKKRKKSLHLRKLSLKIYFFLNLIKGMQEDATGSEYDDADGKVVPPILCCSRMDWNKHFCIWSMFLLLIILSAVVRYSITFIAIDIYLVQIFCSLNLLMFGRRIAIIITFKPV